MAAETLDPAALIRTAEQLRARIEARFPGASLAGIAGEVVALIRETAEKAERLARPDWVIRLLVAAVLLGGGALAVAAARSVDYQAETSNLFALVQSIEAIFNIVILGGAAVASLVTVEARLRRGRVLAALHPFRAVVHVIDMHQLTKDPAMVGDDGHRTPVSPKRDMSAFELSRYLDYCSELLSLTAKAAALYALASRDPVIATSVAEVERLTANLSQKIWQKIMIVEARRSDTALAQALAAGGPAPLRPVPPAPAAPPTSVAVD
ncbi:hypothetical protein [Prosthecomicrobium sp. N25]|uniref:hypothetical protein n=1 Tax=Prosthecomicrobium sp. N25 TaxID=3129254 RepID=UPI0030768DCB